MFCEMYDEVDIIEATSNATMAKLNYEFDMMLMEHRQNLADIELKAVLEYCTDDDIIQMYYKEAEEIQQKSKGILRRIVDAIKALFKKIKEFIFGSKKEEPKDPNSKITLPEDPEALEKETRSALSSIKEFLSGKKDTIKKSALSGAVSGAASVASSKATDWLLNKADSLVDDVQKTLESAAKQMETKEMTPEQQNKGRGLLNWLQKCGTRIMNCAKKITGSNKGSEPSNDKKSDNSKSSPDTSDAPDNNGESRSAEDHSQALNRIKSTLSEIETKLKGDNKK